MINTPKPVPEPVPELAHSSWLTLTAAAHRITFLPGTVMTIIAVLWWMADLHLRNVWGINLAPEALPAPLLHAWLMLYGLFPFFIFGFLFTAVPNWLNGKKISRSAYTSTGLFMAVGAALAFVLPVLGLALHLLGWGIGALALFLTIAGAAPQDKRHAWLAWVALALGWLGGFLFLAWVLDGQVDGLAVGGQIDLLGWALALAIWGCLAPVFLTVCHRMVPWFTSRVLPNYVIVRPYAALYALLLACLVHAGLQASNLGQLTWVADLPLAGITFWLIARWGIARSFGVRLLAMLHIAFVWAGVAFALYALDSLANFFGLAWSLGLAPLHALGMGFFGSMLVGMASRVSLGHSGHKLEADDLTWRAFWLVQAAAVVRLVADVFPLTTSLQSAFISLAGVLWLVAFGTWAWRFAPMYWRPRADGKPG